MMHKGEPNHKAFFKENGFGAYVGYDQYMHLTIIDEECIESVDFQLLSTKNQVVRLIL